MSLAQLHYTSAPPGPDGSGFRFTAVSPGVPQTVLREAEQLIGYEPPRDLPARPDTEELKAFPKAFSCTELSDGGRLLSRSVYTGADYSGRWGNFHTHALHLPPGTRLPDGALPITAWESPRWADATPPDGRPEPVDRFEPSGLLRRDGLVAFARSRADRLAAFFADLAALAGEADSRQIVVVERDSADVAQWIALACAVLPRERAHLLTFTTYTRRPQQARQQIVGVLPSSEPVGHDHRFRVHDCTARPGPGPVADAWADACARIWTAGRPDLFRGNSGDLGPLAVAALVTGVPLRADARAAAAHWTAAHAPTVPEETLTALIAALTEASGTGTGRPATGAGGARTGAGSAGGDAWSRRSGTAPTGTAAGATGTGAGASGSAAGADQPAPGAGGTPSGAASAAGDSWQRGSGTAPTGTAAGATGTGAGASGSAAGADQPAPGAGGTPSGAASAAGDSWQRGSGTGPTGTAAGATGTGAGASGSAAGADQPAPGAGGTPSGAASAAGDSWQRGSGTAPTGTAAGASGSGTGAGGTRASDSGAGPHRTAGTPLDHEPAALAALSARLDGQVPTAVSAPLAAHVLAAAVRDRGPLPALGAGSLTPALRAELARDLAPALRQGVGDPTEPAAGRPLALLRVADLLDVDCVDALPGLAGRLARDLVSGRPADRAAGQEPEHGSAGAMSVAGAGTDPHVDGGRVVCPPAVLDAVHGHPALRTALFGALDALAAAHPPGVAGRLAGCGLPVPPSPGFPHLRMCLQTAGAGRTGDRRARFHGLLRTAGVSPHAAPDVLRTAFQLVWPDGPSGAEDAALLLSELGSDAHRLAGTRDALVEAALAAPADDPAVPVLAADLLRCFTTELRPAHRAPLLLLEYAGLLDGDHDVENWVDHVCGLRDGAPEPVPEPVTRRVYDALARRLLAVAAPGTEPYAPPRPPAPESELYALARAGDPGLLAAYERVARGDRVAERLRTVPGYVAACFCDWSAYPRPHGGWETTRTTLLAKVLRPVVRALPAEDQRAVEEALHRTGRGRLDAYRAWNRPGALGRLAGRLTGRGRREDRQAPWTGDVEPPAGGGRG